MKKFIGILGMAALMLTTSVTSHAQSGMGGEPVNRVVAKGCPSCGDTLVASRVVYTTPVALNLYQQQNVFVTYAVDSISGSPAGYFIVQRSTDGIHWITNTGDSTHYTNANWVIKHQNLTPGDTCSNQSFLASFTPYTASYMRFKVVATSSTQRSRYWIKVKSYNTTR